MDGYAAFVCDLAVLWRLLAEFPIPDPGVVSGPMKHIDAVTVLLGLVAVGAIFMAVFGVLTNVWSFILFGALTGFGMVALLVSRVALSRDRK